MHKDNIAGVKSRGVEVEGYYKITKEWHGFMTYTYNDSSIEIKGSAKVLSGKSSGRAIHIAMR